MVPWITPDFFKTRMLTGMAGFLSSDFHGALGMPSMGWCFRWQIALTTKTVWHPLAPLSEQCLQTPSQLKASTKAVRPRMDERNSACCCSHRYGQRVIDSALHALRHESLMFAALMILA